MTQGRVIAHADMDAFYASVEQRDHPELRGRPVLVGGASSRGVVAAASYEARPYGVHSAMPSAVARRLCPHAVFVRGDPQRYARESRRIFEIFHRFTPAVEGLSLDEAFLDLTGSERLLGPPAPVAQRLRQTVRAETGLAVSVGIAPVKMVAKLASAAAKPDGLLEVAPEEVPGFLHPLPVGRIWGVGPVTEARLVELGFRSIGDLARADPARLEATLGRFGVEVARLARGEDLREVEPYREPVSYSEENTFERDVSERGVLEAAIRRHADAVAQRLRRDGLRAGGVVLKLKGAQRRSAGPRGYPLRTRQTRLFVATDDGTAIASAARELLDRAGLDEPVRLLGVGVTRLLARGAEQLPLFAADAGDPRRARLNRALDAIVERFGEDAVVRGDRDAAERAGLSLQIKRGAGPKP